MDILIKYFYMTIKLVIRLTFVCFLFVITFCASSTSAEVVKIAYIDPLSGAFSKIGIHNLREWQTVAALANQENWAGGYSFEVVGFDNKGSSEISLSVLQNVIDRGFRYVVQGSGSGVASTLIDAINKHNVRNPGRELLYLNYGAIDPDLTNSKCSFWHFSFDANSDMKMEALTTYIKHDPSIKKVYIIGQNYSLGQQVSRSAKAYLARKRPDIQIVGDDLHPIGQIKDFSPYISKIIASGADTVVTANWGEDLGLLLKAAHDANLRAKFYTYYASVPYIGLADVDMVKIVGYWNASKTSKSAKKIGEIFNEKYNEDFVIVETYTGIAMLAKAITQVKSSVPIDVALAMEDMEVESLNGKVIMRKRDHQLQQPLFISSWEKGVNSHAIGDNEKIGLGWRNDEQFDTYVASQPTSRVMRRPFN